MYDSYLVYRQVDDGILGWFRGEEDESSSDKVVTEDLVGYLCLYDTDINEPIMQGKDNLEYLTKNPYGEYSLSGSIFLDARNQADFTDEYSLIYGHHMENNKMFGALDDYLSEDFFLEHQTGLIMVGEEKVYPLQVFAVLEVDAYEKAVFAPTETDVQETVAYIREHAKYLDEDCLDDYVQLMQDKGDPIISIDTLDGDEEDINRKIDEKMDEIYEEGDFDNDDDINARLSEWMEEEGIGEVHYWKQHLLGMSTCQDMNSSGRLVVFAIMDQLDT
jgi:sortase B